MCGGGEDLRGGFDLVRVVRGFVGRPDGLVTSLVVGSLLRGVWECDGCVVFSL
jgi:hypothetical protein